MPPSSIVLVVRARRALARPVVRRLGVAALSAATALTVVSLVEAAGAARDRWGTTRPVAVATRDLAPGDALDAGDVATRELPEAVVPEAALAEPPSGSVVRHPIMSGEPVVAARLAPAGLTGTAALVPPGQRAVAVPTGPAGLPPLAVGDLVDVLAVLPAEIFPGGPAPVLGPTGAGDDAAAEPAFPLVEQAAVVDVRDEAVAVAVPAEDATRVAWAVASGSVVLALAGG